MKNTGEAKTDVRSAFRQLVMLLPKAIRRLGEDKIRAIMAELGDGSTFQNGKFTTVKKAPRARGYDDAEDVPPVGKRPKR